MDERGNEGTEKSVEGERGSFTEREGGGSVKVMRSVLFPDIYS